MKIQSISEISETWKAEGRPFRVSELVAEQARQGRESLRAHESDLLAAAEQPGASAHLLAVAEQIRDHRDAGHYTTQG